MLKSNHRTLIGKETLIVLWEISKLRTIEEWPSQENLKFIHLIYKNRNLAQQKLPVGGNFTYYPAMTSYSCS